MIPWLEQHPTLIMLLVLGLTQVLNLVKTSSKIGAVSEQLSQFEKHISRLEYALTEHTRNGRIHVDPERDAIRLERIEVRLDRIETKIDNIPTRRMHNDQLL